MAFGVPQGRTRVEANSVLDQRRIAGKPRVALHVGHDHRSTVGDNVTTHRGTALRPLLRRTLAGASGLLRVAMGVLPMFVDQRDHRQWHVEDVGGAPRRAVEGAAQRRVEDTALAQRTHPLGILGAEGRRRPAHGADAVQPRGHFGHERVDGAHSHVDAPIGQRQRRQFGALDVPQCQHHLRLRPAPLEPAAEVPRVLLRLRAEVRQHEDLCALRAQRRDQLRGDGARGRRRNCHRHAVQRERVRGHACAQCVHGPASADTQGLQLRLRPFGGVAQAQLVDHRRHAADDVVPVLRRSLRGMVVLRCQAQHRDADVLVELARARRGDRFLGQVDGIGAVAGQQPLVHPARQVQRLAAAQQRVQEGQLRKMPANHQQAHGQRRRQHQTDRSPQRGPECRSDDQRDGRQPGARSVQPGFDKVVADQLQHHDQGQRPPDHRPAGIDRKGQQQRKHRAHQRSDVGDETQHG